MYILLRLFYESIYIILIISAQLIVLLLESNHYYNSAIFDCFNREYWFTDAQGFIILLDLKANAKRKI